jgi:hypothetical protein
MAVGTLEDLGQAIRKYDVVVIGLRKNRLLRVS